MTICNNCRHFSHTDDMGYGWCAKGEFETHEDSGCYGGDDEE